MTEAKRPRPETTPIWALIGIGLLGGLQASFVLSVMGSITVLIFFGYIAEGLPTQRQAAALGLATLAGTMLPLTYSFGWLFGPGVMAVLCVFLACFFVMSYALARWLRSKFAR